MNRGYDWIMKSIMIALVLFAGGIFAADEVADRAAIENTIRGLSVTPVRAGLFTSDFDDRQPDPPAGAGAIPVVIDGASGTVVISKEPMGEAQWFPAGTHGVIIVRKIRFITPEVAIVDAMGRGPMLIVLKKVGTDWKIASLRRLAEN